ncbi:hypothetical protein PPYR_07178 [Photinus pyralis]|uniref:Ras-related protein Rab n=1 Tax=Photinus pyralis TaxID=7054 RepID=A0A5N4AQ10_PHOPY|nr:ras-related protein Rab-32-like [Photinus pyralis]KAB0799298.1 hypothetical protein PPYR_07178 [Photinus pyralis]
MSMFQEQKNLIPLYDTKEILLKVVVIGDFGVGKTAIIKRCTEGVYSSLYKVTIGADFAIKTFVWDDNTRITLQMWDISGHERFGSLTSVYYRYASAAAIVFDLTRPETFTSVEKWLLDLRGKVELPNGQPLPIILLANKGDICLPIIPAHISQFCIQHNIQAWFITSAKENTNIDEAIQVLIKSTLCNYHNPKIPGSICLSNMNQEKRNKCC